MRTFLRTGISGPDDTAYRGGKFDLDIVCGPSYPLRPPSVRFRTPVYHPNISRGDGAICLDLLKPPPNGTWSAARCGLRVMLLSIRELLRNPNVKDPLESSIVSRASPLCFIVLPRHFSFIQAQQLEDNPDAFHKAAATHTQTFAMSRQFSAASSASSSPALSAGAAATASSVSTCSATEGHHTPAARLTIGGHKRQRTDTPAADAKPVLPPATQDEKHEAK